MSVTPAVLAVAALVLLACLVGWLVGELVAAWRRAGDWIEQEIAAFAADEKKEGRS
ncbi:hypothetical protein [Actinomadura rudentiformis]|uniref:hypothetical protein n=1 Tax=Actinomadura rudentiformis TaxID=359158 RepID=UPI00178C7929|nr:hypothetical protein [Actinomadura rudentiformis]